jgi:hypothetical protein
MRTRIILGLTASVSLLGAACLVAPAWAQSTSGAQPGTPSGSTSGPAAGSPTHMGSSGTSSPETKHQSEAVKEQSQSVKPEGGQAGSSGTSQEPHGPATGQPSAGGTEAGPSPGKAKEKQ